MLITLHQRDACRMFRHIEGGFGISIHSFWGPFVHARLVIVSSLGIKYALVMVVYLVLRPLRGDWRSVSISIFFDNTRAGAVFCIVDEHV